MDKDCNNRRPTPVAQRGRPLKLWMTDALVNQVSVVLEESKTVYAARLVQHDFRRATTAGDRTPPPRFGFPQRPSHSPPWG